MTTGDVFSRAIDAFHAGNAVQAERLFKKLLTASPRHVGGLNLLGALLTQLGRWGEAELYLKRALRENTNSDATFYNYGLALKGMLRPSEAIDQFDRALAINPSVADTWNNRGVALNDLGRYREAIADFDKAISLNPGYAQAYCNKGNSLVNLKLIDEALPAYGAALDLAPGLAEAWLGLGNVCAALRRFDEAVAAYDKALALKPELDLLQGGRLHARQHLCDWTDSQPDTSNLLAAIRRGRLVIAPFAVLSLSALPDDHFRCAVLYAASRLRFLGSGPARPTGTIASASPTSRRISASIQLRRRFWGCSASMIGGASKSRPFRPVRTTFGAAGAHQGCRRPVRRCRGSKRSRHRPLHPAERDRYCGRSQWANCRRQARHSGATPGAHPGQLPRLCGHYGCRLR